MSSNEKSIFKSLDWFTIVLYLVMTIYGAISIYAAKYSFEQTSLFSFDTYSGKQFCWIILSLCLGFSLLLIDSVCLPYIWVYDSSAGAYHICCP